MKTIRKILPAMVIAASLSTPALADYPSEVGDKLARGLSNTALGWTEFFKNTYNEPAQNGMLYMPVGLMKGVAHLCGRTAVGVIELVSFPIPSEALVHAPHIWERMGTETTYGEK